MGEEGRRGGEVGVVQRGGGWGRGEEDDGGNTHYLGRVTYDHCR